MSAAGPRVGIAGWFLQFPYRGVGRSSMRVVEQLCGAEGIDPLVLLAEREDLGRIAVPPVRMQPRAVLVPQPFRDLKRRLSPKAYEIAQRIYWEQIGVQVVRPRLHLDVLYSPYHTLPLFPPARSIVTIHDLIPLTEPAYRGGALARAYFSLVGATARRAAVVITDSECSRREIVRLLGIPIERVRAIPLGVEPIFTPVWDQVGMDRVRARLELPGRYLLYVGGADVRKNIGVLLRAMAVLRARVAADPTDPAAAVPPLVIAAPPVVVATAQRPDWRAQARGLGLGPEAVRFVDYIAEEDLPVVYRGAEAFLFPSRAEGFGLTPLEALACGTPVLCAAASSLPEVVGDAALLLPPDDPGAWAEAMLRVCGDEALRGRLRAAGPARAAAFTWERTAGGVLEVIREVARGE